MWKQFGHNKQFGVNLILIIAFVVNFLLWNLNIFFCQCYDLSNVYNLSYTKMTFSHKWN